MVFARFRITKELTACCAVSSGVVITATTVLALIPLYVRPSTSEVSANASKCITMKISLEIISCLNIS